MIRKTIRLAICLAATGLLVALVSGCKKSEIADSGAEIKGSIVHILVEPEDQLVNLGGTAHFKVDAEVARRVDEKSSLVYQWLRDTEVLSGKTNNPLVIEDVSTNNVGLYTCRVSLGRENAVTKPASLMMSVTNTGGGPFPVYGPPQSTPGGRGCGQPCVARVNYRQPWTPDRTMTHSAADPLSTTTSVEYVGTSGDEACAHTKVSLPAHPPSRGYNFTIYFPSGTAVPSGAYAIVLTGFIK
jgi:hypothetical protein